MGCCHLTFLLAGWPPWLDDGCPRNRFLFVPEQPHSGARHLPAWTLKWTLRNQGSMTNDDQRLVFE